MHFVPCVGNDSGVYLTTTRAPRCVARSWTLDRVTYNSRPVARPRRRSSTPSYRFPTGDSSTRTIRCACAELKTPLTSSLSPAKESQPSQGFNPPTYVSAPGKIIAELAGVVCRDDQGWPVWCGGNATVVQLGDVLDRGDCEIGILMLLRELDHQARKEGGALYMINGNHESLNVCGNFRYVTKGAYTECALAAGLAGEMALNWPDQLAARIELYSPGGIVARELAKNPTVLVVNDTVFAHGGLLPIHANYGLERINTEMAAWMRGDYTENGRATPPYIAMGGPNSILWNRTFAQEHFPTPYEKLNACSLLKLVLKKIGAKRLVVGHTPQISGCNCECNGQIWRVDVGMSQGVMNAQPQVIMIDEDDEGATVIDIVQSLTHHDMLETKKCIEENNIQATTTTTMQFESVSIHSSFQQSTVQTMRRRLVSRLKAYV